MKYLILGSAGQIGLELCQFLKKEGHEVLTFDIEDDQMQDLRIKGMVDSRVSESDFVMFLAFDVGGSRYLKKYQHTYDFIDNNARLMVHTFQALKSYRKPFIFASSQMSNMSYSPYGIAKALGESYTRALGGIIVKFWNVYGPEHNLEKSHVITDFIIKAKDYGNIPMMTDALMILSQKYNEINRDKELHITNFEWNTILDVAKIISEEIPCKITPSTETDTVQLNKRNEPDPYILNYWKPTISLKEGIKKIITQTQNGTN